MTSRGRAKRGRKRSHTSVRNPSNHPKRSGDSSNNRLRSSESASRQWSLELCQLATRLGYPEELNSTSQNHLIEACTHRTFAHEYSQSKHGRESLTPMLDNQRLEFLGDSILGMIVASELMHHKPDASEGELSSTRARLINADTLADVAIERGLEPHLRIGRGESKMGEVARRARLADLTEAIIGALYLDLGLEATRTWVWEALSPTYQNLTHHTATIDPKTALQHWAHQTHQKTPVYHHQTTTDPISGELIYTAQVLLGGEVLGCGQASSKKLAHFEAARDAFNRLDAAP